MIILGSTIGQVLEQGLFHLPDLEKGGAVDPVLVRIVLIFGDL